MACETVDYDEGQLADKAARERVNAEMQRPINKGAFLVERFVVRTLRIALGAAVFVAAYYIMDQAYIGDRPLGSLTLNELVTGLLKAGFAMLLVLGGFKIAFGSYDRNADLEGRALAIVHADEQKKKEQAKVAKHYAKSKLRAVLHDPELGLSGRPVLQLLVPLGMIALLYAFIYWMWQY